MGMVEKKFCQLIFFIDTVELLLNGTRVIVLKGGGGGQGCRLSWGGLGKQSVQGLVTNYTDKIIISKT